MDNIDSNDPHLGYGQTDDGMTRLIADVYGKPTFLNTRQEVLQTAEMLVNGDRNTQYGDPSADFRRTAALWNAYLGSDNIGAHDVAVMMCLLKISRISWSPDKLDSWVDLAGYAACGADCRDEVTR